MLHLRKKSCLISCLMAGHPVAVESASDSSDNAHASRETVAGAMPWRSKSIRPCDARVAGPDTTHFRRPVAATRHPDKHINVHNTMHAKLHNVVHSMWQ